MEKELPVPTTGTTVIATVDMKVEVDILGDSEDVMEVVVLSVVDGVVGKGEVVPS